MHTTGIYVKPGKERDEVTAMLVKEGYLPVWLEAGLLDLYYNGFCNSVLWQLFHYVPLDSLDSWGRMTEHRTMQMQWQAYQTANQRFSEVGCVCWLAGWGHGCATMCSLMCKVGYVRTAG